MSQIFLKTQRLNLIYSFNPKKKEKYGKYREARDLAVQVSLGFYFFLKKFFFISS